MNKQFELLIILLFTACLSAVASDIYTPSLPAIADNFNVNIDWVQFSMAIYMAGLSISQLVYGPVSEGFGRRTPLLIGLIIMTIGSIISMSAQSIHLLIAGRFIQGLGAGACAALWRTIFRDTFKGDDLAKYGSYLSIFMVFVVPAAPTLGGYLQEYISWRASFMFLVVYSSLVFLMILVRYQETSQFHHPERLKLSFIKASFGQLLTSKVFMGYSACTFLCYGGFFSWFAISPVLLIHEAGLSPVSYGWINLLVGGVSLGLGSFANGRLMNRLGRHLLMRVGFSAMAGAGFVLVLGYFFWGLNPVAIVIPMAIFNFGVPFIFAGAFAGAFTPFGNIAGFAGSLYGTLQIAGGAVLGMLATHLPETTQVPLGLVMFCCAALAWINFDTFVLKHEK